MMRLSLLTALLTTWLAAPTGVVRADGRFDWDQWRDLPVQNGGRHKPLDTLGRETLRYVANRSSCEDPETGERLDPTAVYLMMLFDWQGWDHDRRDQLLLSADWRPHYAYLHAGDKWDYAPFLVVDFLELRGLLGLGKDQKYVSPAVLAGLKVTDPKTGKAVPFAAWSEGLARQEADGGKLGRLEKKALELADRLWAYQNHRMGRSLEVLPVRGSEAGEWIPIAQLFLARFDDASDPTGRLREAQRQLLSARAAYLAGDGDGFNRSTAELKAALRELGEEAGAYPSESAVGLEVAYNRWAPFRFAWVFVLTAAVGMLLHLGSRWRVFYFGAVAAYGAGMAAMLAGFAARCMISGRPPVTNMYESVVWVGLGVTVFGLVFELIYRRRYIFTAAAAVASVALLVADITPTVLDPSVRPLEPVLRSNFWLSTHVTTITLSYAGFALALGIANITLGYLFVRSPNREAIAALSRFTYKAIQVGVLLLAAGIILGGVWADYSWGRFWGWDPKEVWALVALLGYLSVLHARYAGWVGHRGLAALAVVCFSLVVMAWYGVNFVLGAGLHSYGFGGGGQGWVYSAVGLELAFAAAAVLRSRPGPVPAASGEPRVVHDRVPTASGLWETRQQFVEPSEQP